MSIKNFLQEIEKGLTSSIYLLYANDQYLLKEAALAVKRTIPESERDFSFNIFDIDSTDEIPAFEQIIDVINTIPFFGQRRVVILENFQKLSKKDFKKLEIYMANPSTRTVLIMLHNGIPKKEQRERLKGVKIISLDIREQELPFWIKQKAKQRGVEISDEAIEYLIGVIGPDIGLLSSEIEKFTLLENAKVSTNDIAEIVKGSGDYDVFDLVEALKRKDSEKVFRIYRALSETQESYSLLGALNWQYGRMFTYSKDKGPAMDYYHRAFELLNKADIEIKSSGGVFPMEYLLVRLLQL